jgi:hypothetical protein
MGFFRRCFVKPLEKIYVHPLLNLQLTRRAGSTLGLYVARSWPIWEAAVCNSVQPQASIPAFALLHAFRRVISTEGRKGEERLQSDLRALQYSLPDC